MTNSLLERLPAMTLQARRRIAPHVLTTPLTLALWEPDVELHLKCEHLQYTGSFKLRGALNRLLQLTDGQRERGVIAASTGNHGQGIAMAASLTGVAAEVFVPATASPVKLQAMAALGARIVTVPGDDGLAAELAARAHATRSGQLFVSPYNDPQVIAGQGTVGAELVEQLPDVDVVFVAVGGGGLISGIAATMKAHNPAVRVVGCWPSNAPTMQHSLEAGRILTVAETPTISDGTAGGVEAGAITFGLCQALVDEHVLVSEAEIHQAMLKLAQHERWIVEGAAGVAMAAVFKCAASLTGLSVAVVLCGRNIEYARFAQATGYLSGIS